MRKLSMLVACGLALSVSGCRGPIDLSPLAYAGGGYTPAYTPAYTSVYVPSYSGSSGRAYGGGYGLTGYGSRGSAEHSGHRDEHGASQHHRD